MENYLISMTQKSIPIRLGDVILFSEELVLVKLKNDHEITLEDVKEQIEASRKLTDGKKFAAVLDGGLTLDVQDSAMTYAARYKDDNWKAFAIIVRSISERLFANYYLMFKKPVRPTKVFTTPASAEKWLKQFVKINVPLNYEL